jgi:hypothetical protein
MCGFPYHDEIALIVWAAVRNGRWLQAVNRIIELSHVKPKALIHATAGILDEDLVRITHIAHIRTEQLEHLQAHSIPMANIHASKLYGLVPYRTEHATRLVKVTTIYSGARETGREKREDDQRPS